MEYISIYFNHNFRKVVFFSWFCIIHLSLCAKTPVCQEKIKSVKALNGEHNTVYDIINNKKNVNYIFNKKIYKLPGIDKPEKGISFIDRVFGNKIVRISDRKKDALKYWVKKNYGSVVHPNYPKHNHDNADGALLLFEGSKGSGKLLYDSDNFQLIKTLNARAVNWNQPIEPRWDAHDPHLFYFHFRPPTALSMYNIKTDLYKVLFDFRNEFPSATAITMAEEGNCSYDSRYFAFLVRAPRDGDKWAHKAVVCFDRVEESIVGKLILPISGFESQGAGNWVTMSPSGKYVLLGTAPVLVFDREFRGPPRKMTHGGGWHCDVGLDDEGREVLFYMGGHTYSPEGQSDGCYAMCDLETGKEIILTEKIGGPEGMHFDCSAIYTPGWGLVSTYHAAPEEQTHWAEYSIHLVELTRRKNPPPRIWRICQTHANRGSYMDDPFATFDRFGTKIFFGSNWGVPIKEGGDIDAYQVKLPSGWYDTLMGSDKAKKLRQIAVEMVRKKW